ncbi:MAG: hypothetical protein IJE68_03860 [Clostridia bacterium]|nr:hypothetical protein [Clostridia bacterium]
MKLEIVFKDGRKETFDSVENFKVTEEQIANKEGHASKVTRTPTEGELFEVKPQEIDRSLFQKERSIEEQEKTRRLIQKAFTEVEKHPEKYASEFYTLIPVKNWYGRKSVAELKAYAIELGGLMADWVEQALEWAQRISNGETWFAICNMGESASCYRAIVAENGGVQLVGASQSFNCSIPASEIHDMEYDSDMVFEETVPLVVIKKE